jgi:hypothetical protein
MAIFATKQPTAVEPTPAAVTRPKMIVVIECLDQAYEYANRAGQHLAAMTLDVEQLADRLGHFRDSLIKSLEQSGGDVGAAVESQIREFVGQNQRRVDDANSGSNNGG